MFRCALYYDTIILTCYTTPCGRGYNTSGVVDQSQSTSFQCRAVTHRGRDGVYKYRDVVCKFWARVRLCNLELAVDEADEARRAWVSHASRVTCGGQESCSFFGVLHRIVRTRKVE